MQKAGNHVMEILLIIMRNAKSVVGKVVWKKNDVKGDSDVFIKVSLTTGVWQVILSGDNKRHIFSVRSIFLKESFCKLFSFFEGNLILLILSSLLHYECPE